MAGQRQDTGPFNVLRVSQGQMVPDGTTPEAERRQALLGGQGRWQRRPATTETELAGQR